MSPRALRAVRIAPRLRLNMPLPKRYTCVLCRVSKTRHQMHLVDPECVGKPMRDWVPVYGSARNANIVCRTLASSPVFALGDRICTLCVETFDAHACVVDRALCQLRATGAGACRCCGKTCDTRRRGLCTQCYTEDYRARSRERVGPEHACPGCGTRHSYKWSRDGYCSPCASDRARRRTIARRAAARSAA